MATTIIPGGNELEKINIGGIELTPVVVQDPTDPDFNGIFNTHVKRFSEKNFDKRDDLLSYMAENGPQNNVTEMWVGLRDPQGTIVAAINMQAYAETGRTQLSYVTGSGDVHNSLPPGEVNKALLHVAEKAAKEITGKTGISGAAETSLLLQTGSGYNDPIEGKGQVLRSQALLAENGYQRVLGLRYLEASYDKVNGDPTSFYDFHIKPNGKTVTVGDLAKLLEENFSAYPEGTSLTNEALRPMTESLAKMAGIKLDKGPITEDTLGKIMNSKAVVKLAPPDDHKQIAADIDKAAATHPNLKQTLGPNGRTIIGDIPELQALTYAHYGKDAQMYSDILPKAAGTAMVLDKARTTITGADTLEQSHSTLTREQREHLATAQTAWDTLRGLKGSVTRDREGVKGNREERNRMIGALVTTIKDELIAGGFTKDRPDGGGKKADISKLRSTKNSQNEVTPGRWNQVLADALPRSEVNPARFIKGDRER